MLKEIPYKYIDRILYPAIPVAVTAEYNNRVGCMIAAWWTQISFNPFLIGVSIAPERYTYKLIKKSKRFGLNFIDFRYITKLPYLGDVSERFMKNKVLKSGFTIFRGKALNIPLLNESSASIEMELKDIFKCGDHDLFVGKVVKAYASQDFVRGLGN